MFEWFQSLYESIRHAVELVAEDVATVNPWLVVAGVLLHVLHQVVRTRGWFNIIRASYPDAEELRARDVTKAFMAGAGLNGIVPARGGDLAKLYLIRRRSPQTRWSTLIATFLPETLFETVVGISLVIWALSQGFLPVPTAPSELPALDVSFLINHPVISSVGTGVALLAGYVFLRWLRTRGRALLERLRLGLAILGTPRAFITGVVSWQALARVIRLGSLACFMAAFDLPVTVETVVLVMAASGAGKIIPIAPVSGGLRIAMLAYGFVEVTGQAVDIAAITAFSVGVGAILFLVGLAISIALLGRELGTIKPKRMMTRIRERLEESGVTDPVLEEPGSPAPPAAPPAA